MFRDQGPFPIHEMYGAGKFLIVWLSVLRSTSQVALFPCTKYREIIQSG